MSDRRLEVLVPGDLATRTGGYVYARRILAGLESRGWRIQVHSLDGRFPHPTVAALAEAERVLALIPSGRTVLVDGLALGAMPEIVERFAERLDLIALVHHPLALETGLAPSDAARLRVSERRALAAVRQVVTTSGSTAVALADYGVESARIRVVVPGTDPAPLVEGSGSACLDLLCVATLTPRKGHSVLFDALSQLRDLPWRLTCVGSDRRDPDHAAVLRARLEALDLADRIRLTGELDEAALDRHYQTADACVLASHHEGYGMVLAEALARGLPIVSTSAGAIPETLPDGAGLLVPPGDPDALAAALRRVIQDDALRASLRQGARRARAELPTWDTACEAFAEALGDLSVRGT